ncbi:hypothetical protein WK03_35420 [Burkholderia cepacia]|uniref:hypothetical protein n=1 Tax=Burkholderia cepacia TaxID=292 RepID=UPI0007528433|nr:hypothetical protein [Burkholderia cepacia]KVQ35760.1 hypothetical protein WK03_35420 [Burkholderia cepacia]
MLENLTLIRAPYSAMIDLKVGLRVIVSMDAGSTQTEIGEHPDFGQLILIDSSMGDSTIAVGSIVAEKLSKWLSCR